MATHTNQSSAPAAPSAPAEDLAGPVDAAPVDEASDVLLALLTDDSDEPASPIVVPERIAGVVLGTIVALAPLGATIAWLGAPGGVFARVMTVLGPEHLGREVAVAFEQGDPARPLVLGVMERFVASQAERAATEPREEEPREEETSPVDPHDGAVGLRFEALADGQRVVLEADRELVLSCGKASITLTRAGKVLIRGAYVSSHSTGTQRIRGGTVEIN